MGKNNKIKIKRRNKYGGRSRTANFDKTEEKYNNTILLMDLKPWEKAYLRLLPWSYVEAGVFPKIKGYLNLLEPLKCEETLVRMDQDDVKAVLKIMGHNWPAGQKKAKNRKETKTKNWGTKALDELVVSIGREEDELIRWWRLPYCMEMVKKHLKPSTIIPPEKKPWYFNTYDEEQRLWGFAERMESAMLKNSSKVSLLPKPQAAPRRASSRVSIALSRRRKKNTFKRSITSEFSKK